MAVQRPPPDIPQHMLFSDDDVTFKDEEDEDVLGSGSFATVYKAKLKWADSVSDGKTVAAKVLTTGPRLPKNTVKVFFKETSILLNLKPHPNIVKFYGICPNPKRFCIVLEYVEGGSLFDWLYESEDESSIARNPDVDLWNHRIDIACQIIDGLAHLHSQSPPIAHMDLKPGNILIRISGGKFYCKITDFGLSKMKDESRRSGSLHPKGGTGTLMYMAPEIFYGLGPTLAGAVLADMHSFSVVLWEIKERRCIFLGMVGEAIMNFKNCNHIPSSKQTCPFLPVQFDDVIEKCYSCNPKKRLSSSEAGKRLHRIKDRFDSHGSSEPNPAMAQQEQCNSTALVEADHHQVSPMLSKTEPIQLEIPPAASLRQSARQDYVIESTEDLIEAMSSSVSPIHFTPSRILNSTRPTKDFSKIEIQRYVDDIQAETKDASEFADFATLTLEVIDAILHDRENGTKRLILLDSGRQIPFATKVWKSIASRRLLERIGFELFSSSKTIQFVPDNAGFRGLEVLTQVLAKAPLSIASVPLAPISTALSSAKKTSCVASLEGSSLGITGCLGSLFGFLNTESHHGRTLREYPSIYMEVKTLFAALARQDDLQTLDQFHTYWLSVFNYPVQVVDSSTLTKYHCQFEPLLDMVGQFVHKKFGQRSPEACLFDYLIRVAKARPVISQAKDERQILFYREEFLDASYLKFPAAVPKKYFSRHFLEKASGVELCYSEFINQSNPAVVPPLLTDLLWINLFFLNHFLSDLQLDMKDRTAFTTNEIHQSLESCLKLAEILQKCLLDIYAKKSLAPSTFQDDLISLFSQLDIADCESDGILVLNKLQKIIEKDSHHSLKAREFWMLEQEIAAAIFSKKGMEAANVFFVAVSVLMLAEVWSDRDEAMNVDRILANWHSFIHRGTLHFFQDKTAEHLQLLTQEVVKEMEKSATVGFSLGFNSTIQNHLFFLGKFLCQSLKKLAA
eukprot:m.23338 g.23338  ORF g.23338 m.23338 type:complete len:962 (+) comp28457_c0_seq2:26-2911(+)